MTTLRRPPNLEPQTPPIAATPFTDQTMEQYNHYPLFAGWALLPMRLFLGITFAYAGIQKLTDPQFFHKSTPGYIGNQLIGFAHGSPLAYIIMKVAIPHAVLFGYAIAFGEIAIGLAALFGLLFRPTAIAGLGLSLIFFLTASWHVYPYFYGSDIVFAFCWLVMLIQGPLATGYPALDTWLMTKLAPQRTHGLKFFIRTLLIGTFDRPQTTLSPLAESNTIPDVRSSTRTGNAQQQRQQHMRAIIQKKQEARRNFLLGTITGMSTVAGLGIIGFVLNSLFSNGQNTTTQTNSPSSNNTPNSNTSTGTNTGTGTGTVIAQVSSVTKNSSTTFTIPSTGDPGVLVHLANDQFVAYDATCTHAGCQVDYDPTSQNLICPCHGATYDPTHQAAVLGGPTSTPLTSVAIHVDSSTGAITLA